MKKLLIIAILSTMWAYANSNRYACMHAIEQEKIHARIADTKRKSGVNPVSEYRLAREYLFLQIGYCMELLDPGQKKEFEGMIEQGLSIYNKMIEGE